MRKFDDCYVHASVADVGCLSRIRLLICYPSRIPNQGVKKAPGPGSGSATLVQAVKVLLHCRCNPRLKNQCQHPVPPSPLRSRVWTRGGSPHCSSRLHVQSLRQTLQEPQRVAKTHSQTCHRCRKSAHDHWRLIKKRSVAIEFYGRLGEKLMIG